MNADIKGMEPNFRPNFIISSLYDMVQSQSLAKDFQCVSILLVKLNPIKLLK